MTSIQSSDEPFAHLGQVALEIQFELSWDLDVPCEQVPNAGTHKRLWPAATTFCKWLQWTGCMELGWNIAKGSSDMTHLLELGSGLGWLGMVIAKNLPGAHLTLTDLPGEATSSLKAVVEKAAFSNLLPILPQVQQLDWADFAKEARGPVLEAPGSTAGAFHARMHSNLHGSMPYCTVFGTDLCWDHLTTLSLAGVLGFFAKSALQTGGWPRVIYAHWNRSTRIIVMLLEQLREQCLEVRVLHPPGFSPKLGEPLEQALHQDSSGRHVPACLPDACVDSTASGSKSVESSSTGSDEFLADFKEQPMKQAPCPGEAESDEECDWEAVASQWLFEDARDQFPDPIFFVFEILARPARDVLSEACAPACLNIDQCASAVS